MSYIVALTGGIGSGKTTIANEFATLGVPLVDADLIARQVVKPGTKALHTIIDHFDIPLLLPDGSLDRKKLRALIFDNNEEKEWLNHLLHPLIAKETKRQIHAITAPYLLWVIPLLIENQLQGEADRILVINADPETQIERMITRDNIDKILARKMLLSQVSNQTRLALADDIVNNNQPIIELKPIIAQLHQQYLALAAKKSPRKNDDGLTMLTFEHPLHEKMRTWLRIDYLLNELNANLIITNMGSALSFFHVLNDLLDVLERIDIRIELQKELSTQQQKLLALKNAPGVDIHALDQFLQQLA